MIPDSKIHMGHRERMRRKLSVYGSEIFDTYELLEMLLYSVIPVRDTNPVAKRLLAEFDGLDGVLSATKDELECVSGIGSAAAEYLVSVGRLPEVVSSEKNKSGAAPMSSYEEVGEYFVDYFDGCDDYRVAILLLDNSMRPIGTFDVYFCDYGKGNVNAAPFLDLAISNRASSAVIAHNHPFGPLFPTHSDILSHKVVAEGFRHSGIELLDHYLVCGRGYSRIGEMAKGSGVEELQCEFGVICFKSNVPKNGKMNLPVKKEMKEREYLAEMLGFFVSKKDECPRLADSLIMQYHTLEGVLSRSMDELAAVIGAGSIGLKLIAGVNSRRFTDKYRVGKKYGEWVSDLVRWHFFGQSVEQVCILLFDKDEKYLGLSKMSEGTVSASEIVPRKAIEAASRMKAKSAVLAHNHPCGISVSSQNDVYATAIVAHALSSVGVELRCHMISAGADVGFVEIPTKK